MRTAPPSSTCGLSWRAVVAGRPLLSSASAVPLPQPPCLSRQRKLKSEQFMHSGRAHSWQHLRGLGTKRCLRHLPLQRRCQALQTLPCGSGVWHLQGARLCRLGRQEQPASSGRWHPRVAGAALLPRSGAGTGVVGETRLLALYYDRSVLGLIACCPHRNPKNMGACLQAGIGWQPAGHGACHSSSSQGGGGAAPQPQLIWEGQHDNVSN